MEPPGPVSGAPREAIQPATASQAFVTLEFAKERHGQVGRGTCTPAAHGLVARAPLALRAGVLWEPWPQKGA
jgi:hypothetical protein